MQKIKMGDLISRSFEFRKDEDGNIVGIPIVFDKKTDIAGMFSETIAKGAVSENVLKDVAFFYNHDLNSKPLARTRTGKLRFQIKDDGVHMIASINRDRSDANDLYLAIKDGDIDGMSFMFRVEDEEWRNVDSDYPERIITKIGYVQEVSAVNYPAYESTYINARANGTLDSDRKALDSVRAAFVDTKDTILLELVKLQNRNRLKG